tara:strand:+ start:719 stop:1450 length:732 start_codon:yes stop_codon:yes gene_type:complete
MQKLNRYLLETDKQRANTNYNRSDAQRQRAEVFCEHSCSNCGWSIDPTTPHWVPDSGHSGGIYHIHCYTPGLPTPEARTRKAWQCFCGHECRHSDYGNQTGFYGAGCNQCDRNHYGDDCDYAYNKMPHECSLCGWVILPIEIPILNKQKTNHDFPLGWMHECCYTDRVDEIARLNEEYEPITLVMPQGEVVEVEMFDDMTDRQLELAKETASNKQWVSSTEKQIQLVEELKIWQRFGVERIPE